MGSAVLSTEFTLGTALYKYSELIILENVLV